MRGVVFLFARLLQMINARLATRPTSPIGPQTESELLGYLSIKNPPNSGPNEIPLEAHNPKNPIFLPRSSGRDILVMTVGAVGKNNISPNVAITTARIAILKLCIQLNSKKPVP